MIIFQRIFLLYLKNLKNINFLIFLKYIQIKYQRMKNVDKLQKDKHTKFKEDIFFQTKI